MNIRLHDSLVLSTVTAGCANGLIFHVLGDAAGWDHLKVQCSLIRCIFANPTVYIEPMWLTSTVFSLATAAYQERALPSGEIDPDRLAVLSDALEESGCDNSDILDHLRAPGPHVRGCWALDHILGKR